MATRSLEDWIQDVRLLGEEQHALVQAVRALVRTSMKSVSEQLKYGGLLFASEGTVFAGVFAYRAHVSVEFSHGARIADPSGCLEGAGKGRRHLKLRTGRDIADRQLAAYLKLALAAAREGGVPGGGGA